jgi:hypothetical protein
VVAPLMPQMVACFKALLAPPCWPWNAYKGGIFVESKMREGWESAESVWEREEKRRREKEELLPSAA